MVRRLLSAAVVMVMPLAAFLAPGAAIAGTAPPTCAGVITLGESGFNPPSVPVGQASTLTVVAQNCTGQTVQGTVYWYGTYTAPGGQLAQGCPVLDPVGEAYKIAPQGSYTLRTAESDSFPGCQATGLHMTVDFTASGVSGLAAQATADLIITGSTQTGPPGACHVTYSPQTWAGGFTADVTVCNPGTAALSGWTLTFTFPGDEKITSAWNATVTQTGASVSATNTGYNATIPAGGSQSFGFQGSWASSAASPTAFSVNGTPCT